MLQTWQITASKTLKVEETASSLDEVTQRLPEGYYSTFRTYDGGRRVLGLSHHFRRLYEPVSRPAVDESFLRRQLSVLLEPYRSTEARVRVMMTREGQVYLAIAPLQPLPRHVYEKGVGVETTELQREHPRLKSTSFIGRSDRERKHIAQEGIFEALLVRHGKVLEGMTSNFFYILGAPKMHRDASEHSTAQSKRDAILSTARAGILLGVTRETVIEIARGRGLELRYEPLPVEQIGELGEAFITSSSRGIVPVVTIDGVTIGEGSPGPITRDLMNAYESHVLAKAEQI